MTSFARFAAALRSRRTPGAPPLVVLASVGSTQALARRIVEKHRSEESVPQDADLVAWEQTAGRGRGGRDWNSPAGTGVWATALRRVPGHRLQGIPVRVATALADPLAARLGEGLRIRWPNDLLVDGRKIGGILVDAHPTVESGVTTAAIGFGVNVGAAPLETAISLRDLGIEIEPAELAAELLAALDVSIGADALPLARFEELLLQRPGETIRCRLVPEDDPVEARFVGLDPTGNLRLEIGGRSRVVPTAELLEAGA